MKNIILNNKKAHASMQIALNEAKKALNIGEIPVGAALFHKSELLVTAHNECELKKNATDHAEMLIVKRATTLLKSRYLEDCVLYVTLEPCCQCATALVNSHLGCLIYAAYDLKYGACGSEFQLCSGQLGWKIPFIGGFMRQDSEMLLQKQFQKMRNR